MERTREGATAQRLDGIWVLFGKVGERLQEVFVERRAGGAARPRVERDVGDFQVVAQRKPQKNRHALKDRRDVAFRDGLEALPAPFFESLSARFHETQVTPRTLQPCVGARLIS
jgi:hypothetical protein